MDPQGGDVHTWAAGLGAALVALGAAVKWWFHVRRLAHADEQDGAVTKSISYVVNELRAELERGKKDREELSTQLQALRIENHKLRTEIEAIKTQALATCAVCLSAASD